MASMPGWWQTKANRKARPRQDAQHILGRISPANVSTTRVVPMGVFNKTRPWGEASTFPMMTDSSPYGTARIA